ncbi:MAG TPA: hypothetical protein VF976_15865 [Gemmatimonadales bacterium]
MNDDTRLHDDELREVAQRLGARAAERLDVERTAQAVVTRLRTEPRADVRVLGRIQPVWLRIAALLVLAAGAGVIARSLLHKPPVATALAAPAGAELSELSANQLRQVLEAVGQAGGDHETVSSQDVSLDDLSAPQLRALLEALEG